MILHAFTDGASKGNPGESGIGLLVRTEQGETVFSHSAYIGRVTNNIAEYTALLTLVRKMQTVRCSRLLVHSDSELMVRQMNGEYRIKNEELRKLHDEIRKILIASPFEFEIKYVSRDANKEADRLANQGIASGNRTTTDEPQVTGGTNK